jgi:hypothetical protein
MKIERHMASLGLVSGHIQHLLPYVLDSKEVVSFARGRQRQNGRSFHAGIR